MKYIDEDRINELLTRTAGAGPEAVDRILAKAQTLTRLSLDETAALLAVEDPASVKKIFTAAARVKDAIYGRRVVLFAPLYISNICANRCLYCSFKADNREIERKALTPDEIREQVTYLLTRGHKRILVVAGEAGPRGQKPVDYYVDAINAVYSARAGMHRIKRVNINCAPLSVDEFRRLKAAGIGTFQIFQETYHDATYRQVHPAGPKSDPDNRLEAVDRAFAAGIDDVGIGPLYGLYDWRFETLALLMHVEHLEKTFNVGPHTISVPRIEPAVGSELSQHVPHRVSDDDFKKLVAVLRLSVPYTGIIMSTRESPAMRDELVTLGVSQISAESRTSPGGYGDAGADTNIGAQFTLSDQRTLDEVMGSLIARELIPSFCAACYRMERTGEAFMSMAKPGTIKGKCNINALVTLREYLDDFASPAVRREGYRLIERAREQLNENDRALLERLFAGIEAGRRDAYV